MVGWVAATLAPAGSTAFAAEPAHRAPAPQTAGEQGSGPRAPAPVLRAGQTKGASGGITWSDIGGYPWARTAINYVGGANPWMRDFAANADGTYPFSPGTLETRKYFARAVVEAFAPDGTVDPSITFTDLDPTSPFYVFANVAAQHGWIAPSKAGTFGPDTPVTMMTVHRALVLALGLKPAATALNALHTADGQAFATPQNFGTTLLGMRLYLRYNSGNESQDVNPRSPLTRAQVAYSLYRAATVSPYSVTTLQDEYRTIVLPPLTPVQFQIVQWGVKYVGYPYVWAGEWGLNAPEPSGLGGQPVPGFDCSGLVWWLMRQDDGGVWNVAPPRPYAGWGLPQRTSADMASYGKKVAFADLQPGDLAFFSGAGNGVVDHVDTYIGNGWALDSSSGPGGVTIMWVGTGNTSDHWYNDHFVHGRRVIGP
jgi:cell wall-associated NlpC family hydrolase